MAASLRLRILLAGTILTGFVVLWGCTGNDSAADPARPKQGGPGQPAPKPSEKSSGRILEQPAQIEAYQETPLVARISGYVVKIVDIGTKVSGPSAEKKLKGDVLAELWVPELEKELAQKKALVKLAEAEVKQFAASLKAAGHHMTTAEAMIDEARAAESRAQASYNRWAAECKRLKDLVERRVVDRQILDETENQCLSSEAAIKETKAKVRTTQALKDESAARKERAEADLEAARERVKVAQAEEERVAALFDYRFIYAPYDGVITRRRVHKGHHMAAGVNSEPLLVVASDNKFRVIADFPEADAGVIRKDTAATVRVPALKDQKFSAKVSRTSWSLDTRSRTLRVEIDLSNDENVLRPGMFAFVTLHPKAGN